jgi:hypothetical protein
MTRLARAVDSLSDKGFSVEHTTISRVGPRMVEHVLGRLTYLKAAGLGAAVGAWFGVLLGVFLAVFNTNACRPRPRTAADSPFVIS